MSISISHLHKAYGDKSVIDDLNLELPETGVVALSGPSGCGKTTLLYLLAGLAQQDAGTINGIDFKQVSMVFQEDRLLPWLSALENIALVLADPREAATWLARMDMSEWAGHFPAELSGGMRRRIALARALAFESRLLLLDEPFLGMDSELRARLYGFIRDTARRRLVLLVTHDAMDIEHLADQVLLAGGPPLRIDKILSD